MIDYAVIGVGNMGQHHARVAARHPRFNLVGVIDTVPARAQTVADRNNTQAYPNIHALCAEHKPQAISVCVPSSLHLDIALEALDADMHILVEKPIADNVENGAKILNAAKKVGKSVMVGHVERYNPAVQKVKELIENDAVGEISSIIARRVGIMPPQIKDADIVIDLAIHDIDILCYLMGKQPTNVHTYKKASILDDRADCVEMFFEFEGASGFLQANWVTPVKIRRLNVTGDKGYLTMDYIEQTIDLFQGKTISPSSMIMPYAEAPAPTHQLIELPREEPLVHEMEHFADIISAKTPHDCSYAINALKIAFGNP